MSMLLAGFLVLSLPKTSQQCAASACKRDTLDGNVGVFAQQLSFQVCIFIYVNAILSSGVITDEATDPL